MGDDEPLKDGVNPAESVEPAPSESDPDADWVVDDASIPDEAKSLRKLTEPGQVIFDDLSGALVAGVSAYAYRDADGMSVYVSTAMEEQELSVADLMRHCERGIVRVSVATIRRDNEGTPYKKHDISTTVAAGERKETPGGVIMREATTGPEDLRIRRSHGLVRIRERPTARTLWNAFRHKLIQGSEYCAPGTETWVAANGAA